MKNYVVYWRFKGKAYMKLPLNICKISAFSKKEAIKELKETTENILIKRIVEE